MIVTCGEALIDMLPRKGTDGAAVFQPFAGGSVFNVAIALGRLGVPAGFFGGLSTDFFGTMLREALEKSRVDVSFANFSDRPTTLAFVTLIAGQARYAFFDEHSAGRMLTSADLPAFPAALRALHFGSFSLAAEPCGSAYEALMQREHVARVISLDPNIRPTLIKNRDAHLARLERLVGLADIVKFSDDDLAWMAPETAFDRFAKAWLERGAKLVIMTRGEAGALARSRRASVAVPSVKVTVADTIGAGDTFSAALMARLDQRGLLTKPAVAALSEAAGDRRAWLRRQGGRHHVVAAGGGSALAERACLERPIERLVEAEALAIGGLQARVRHDRLDDLRLAAHVLRRFAGQRQPGEASGPEGRALVGTGNPMHGNADGARDQLQPEAAPRPAADRSDRGGRTPGGMKRDLGVDKRERDTFQHGLRQVLRRGGVVEAEETGARLRIVMRRPLTGKVGQEYDA